MKYLSSTLLDCKKKWPLLKIAIWGSAMLSVGCVNNDINQDIISTRPGIEEQDTNHIVQSSDAASAEANENVGSNTTGSNTEHWCYGDELSDFEFSDDELEM